LLWSGGVSAALLAAGIALWNSNGFPSRFPAEVVLPNMTWMNEGTDNLACVHLPPARISAGHLCSYGAADVQAMPVLVWGDSHAMALLPAWAQLADRHHLRLYFAASSGCRPLLGFSSSAQRLTGQTRCLEFNDAVAQAVQRLNPRIVILNAHWIDTDSDLIPHGDSRVVPGVSSFRLGLQRTLQTIAAPARSVCVVLDVPTFRYFVPYAVGMARRRGIGYDFLRMSRTEAFEQLQEPENVIRDLARRGEIRSVDPKDVLCRTGTCVFEKDGSLLYGDRDHLSRVGAQFVSSTIDGCFNTSRPGRQTG
jgi:hypothetical protein